MQTSKWGNRCWVFLHGLPACFDEMIEPEKEKKLIEFLVLLRDILPCKYCRASYKTFLEELHPQTFLEHPPLGYKEHSRLALARWFFDIHNKVNEKLEKPISKSFLKTCCTTSQDFRKEWILSFWDMLFVIIWNYMPNEKWRKDALLQFIALLPEILKGCPFGRNLGKCISQHFPDAHDLASLDGMKMWAYRLRVSCSFEEIVPPFSEIDQRFEGWRSGTCNEKAKMKMGLKGKKQKC